MSGAVTHSSRIVGASAPQRCKQLPVQKSSFFVCGIGFFGDSRQSARSGRFHASPRATATRPTLLQPPCCSHPTVTLLQRCTRGAHGRMHTDCGRAAAGGLAGWPRVSAWPLRSGPQHWAPGSNAARGPLSINRDADHGHRRPDQFGQAPDRSVGPAQPAGQTGRNSTGLSDSIPCRLTLPGAGCGANAQCCRRGWWQISSVRPRGRRPQARVTRGRVAPRHAASRPWSILQPGDSESWPARCSR